MSVTICVTLDTRRVKKRTGKYPVKLLVTYERDPQRYQTIYDLTKEEYGSLSAPNVSEKLRKIRDDVKRIKREAEVATDKIKPFSYQDFEKDYILNNPLFRQRKFIKAVHRCSVTKDKFDYTPFYKKFPILKEEITEPGTFGFVYLQYIRKLLQEGRIGTASNHHSSYQSLKKFRGNLLFSDITVSYLKEYENWMKANDKSKTTIGIYIRTLRTIFNEADAAGFIKKEKCYPFGRRKYLIPKTKNTKKSLVIDDISRIYYYKPTCDSEWRARDYWLFLYFGNGMNTKDLALLKYKNIDGEYLNFERAKTEWSTRNDPRPITVYLTEDMQNIISRWGNNDKDPNNYIFPIMISGLTPLREYELIQLIPAYINGWMAKIGERLGIKKRVTTYVARHSFSTILKRAGASTEYIQECLGHTDVKTTENYLDSFENEVKKEFSKRLTSFK